MIKIYSIIMCRYVSLKPYKMTRAATSPRDYGVLHNIFMLRRILCQWKVYCVYICLLDTQIDGLPLLNNNHTKRIFTVSKRYHKDR